MPPDHVRACALIGRLHASRTHAALRVAHADSADLGLAQLILCARMRGVVAGGRGAAGRLADAALILRALHALARGADVLARDVRALAVVAVDARDARAGAHVAE